MEKVDLRRYPFRGILKEMSEELGKPVAYIHKGLFGNVSPNPKYAELFEKKLEERRKTVRRFKLALKKAS